MSPSSELQSWILENRTLDHLVFSNVLNSPNMYLVTDWINDFSLVELDHSSSETHSKYLDKLKPK